MNISQNSIQTFTCPACGFAGRKGEAHECVGVNQTDYSLTSKEVDAPSLSASFNTPSMPGGSSQTSTFPLFERRLAPHTFTRSVRCADGTTVVCLFPRR